MTLSIPFSYLGVNIGGHMSRIKSWDVVINKVHSRLSKWKMKVLSIGGRLTLLKYVLGSTPIYYMSLFKAPMHVINKLEAIRSYFFNGVDPNVRKMTFVKWDNVLASKEKGSLGVSSFYVLNRALIFKWVWRFRTQINSLWSRAIKAIHGEDGNLGYHIKSSFTSNWINIIRMLPTLYNKGIDLLGSIKKRLYALESDKGITVAKKMTHPSLGTSFIQEVALSKFRWLRCYLNWRALLLQICLIDGRGRTLEMVNIFSWRVKLNNLPTRLNLSRRDLYKKIARWWDVNMVELASYEDWWCWLSSLRLSSKLKMLLEARMFDDIVALSFTWCRSRSNLDFSWIDW
ncbi:hypothetical protein Tco_1126083, partial [Tanacetum coccineum]